MTLQWNWHLHSNSDQPAMIEDAFDVRLCSIVADTFHFLLLLHFLQNLENSALSVDTTWQTISC